jgi:hypothetical protein
MPLHPVCRFLLPLFSHCLNCTTLHQFERLLECVFYSLMYGDFPAGWIKDAKPLTAELFEAGYLQRARPAVGAPLILPANFAVGQRPVPLARLRRDGFRSHLQQHANGAQSRPIRIAQLVEHLEERSNRKSIEPVVLFATKKLVDEFGGVLDGLPDKDHLWHDLSAAEMTLVEMGHRFHRDYLNGPRKVSRPRYSWTPQPPKPEPEPEGSQENYVLNRWRGEAWLIANKIGIGGYYPDAAIIKDDRIVLAAEFCGRYSKQRLQFIQDSCLAHSVGVVLW